jgi:hypothetical protein
VGIAALLLDVMCRCKARVIRHAEHLLPKLKLLLCIASDAARGGSSSSSSSSSSSALADGYESCASAVASYEVIIESPHVGKVTDA